LAPRNRPAAIIAKLHDQIGAAMWNDVAAQSGASVKVETATGQSRR
jgi:hypothetical protein